jgi:magnesium-transporting ATPase (P-type)
MTTEKRKELKIVIDELIAKDKHVIGFAKLTLDATLFNVKHTFNLEKWKLFDKLDHNRSGKWNDRSVPRQGEFPMREFQFIGVVTLIDPVREGVVEAVESLKKANMQVVLLTGDDRN